MKDESLKYKFILYIFFPRVPPGENPLAFLRTQPQFVHMRQAIQRNPALLPALLQQLGRENPQLLQVTAARPARPRLEPCNPFCSMSPPDPPSPHFQQISQHQERFIQMLNEPVGEGGDAPEVGDMGAAGEEGAPVNYIQVTPQEKEAIERVSDPRAVSQFSVCILRSLR